MTTTNYAEALRKFNVAQKAAVTLKDDKWNHSAISRKRVNRLNRFAKEIIGAAEAADAAIEVEVSGSRIQVPPQLIRKGSATVVRFITDAKPKTPELSTPLINISVVDIPPVWDREVTVKAWFRPISSISGLVGTSAALGLVAGVITYLVFRK